jgi:cobalt-zinc-cadmium efflux system membrane fusion protein
MASTEQRTPNDGGDGPAIVTTPSTAPPSEAKAAPRRMGFGQKVVVAILLLVVLIPPAAGFFSYFSGVPLHLLASTSVAKAYLYSPPSVSLVAGRAHTVDVPDEVATDLGIRQGNQDSVAVAKVPETMQPLVLSGSTALDPTRLARIKARFAPAKVIELAKVWDAHPKTGQTEYRELRPGDSVAEGEVLGVFYSVDVGSKKNDLLDALVQLQLDQRILDEAQKHVDAVPEVFLISYARAVEGDRNAVNRSINNLKAWDIPQKDIDELIAEAKKIGADKSEWTKTKEGRWVKGEKQAQPADNSRTEAQELLENPWGRVTLVAPFAGVIVERNVHLGEMVVDNTVNLFQIADVDRLLVIANCPEDALPTLESLRYHQRRWTVRTVGAGSVAGLPGTIDEIGYVIDPNQHTAVIKGYVENPGKHIRGGQFVTATVNIPPPDDVVEIPTDALIEDGLQSLVFVQPDAADHHRFTMRRVQVTHRFERTVFVRSTPLPKEEQLTASEVEAGLLPLEPLLPGERVLLSGTLELKAAELQLESPAAKNLNAPDAK